LIQFFFFSKVKNEKPFFLSILTGKNEFREISSHPDQIRLLIKSFSWSEIKIHVL